MDFSFEQIEIVASALERLIIRLALVLLLLPSVAVAQAFCADSELSSTEPFKLHATVSELGRTGITDSIWRYFSDQGAAAYSKGDYASAERYYQTALRDAQKHKIDDRNLVLITTNLAASLREQGKFEQSGVLFRSALSKSEKLGHGKNAPYSYALRQYATLLRKTGREDEARFAYESAQSGSRLIRPSISTGAAFDRRSPLLSGAGPAPAAPLGPAPPAVTSTGAVSYPFEPSGDQYEDTIIFDFTVIGVSQFPGAAGPDARVFHHSRTAISGARADWVRDALGQMGAGQ